MPNLRTFSALAAVLLFLSACQGASEVCDPTDPLCSSGGTPSISITNATTAEDDGDAVFTVTLSSAASSTVTVSYATSDGTATAPRDYESTTGSLSFSPGTTVRQVTVPLWPDVFDEGSDETFTVTLSAPTNATLATASATGTITEDDICALSGSIDVGQTRSAALSVTDCSFDFGGLPLYYDLWLLTLSSTTTVQIDQTSLEIDSWVEIWETDGTFLLLDDDGGIPPNSRISTTFSPGDYIVVSTSFDSEEVGDYDLSIQ